MWLVWFSYLVSTLASPTTTAFFAWFFQSSQSLLHFFLCQMNSYSLEKKKYSTKHFKKKGEYRFCSNLVSGLRTFLVVMIQMMNWVFKAYRTRTSGSSQSNNSQSCFKLSVYHGLKRPSASLGVDSLKQEQDLSFFGLPYSPDLTGWFGTMIEVLLTILIIGAQSVIDHEDVSRLGLFQDNFILMSNWHFLSFMGRRRRLQCGYLFVSSDNGHAHSFSVEKISWKWRMSK